MRDPRRAERGGSGTERPARPGQRHGRLAADRRDGLVELRQRRVLRLAVPDHGRLVAGARGQPRPSGEDDARLVAQLRQRADERRTEFVERPALPGPRAQREIDPAPELAGEIAPLTAQRRQMGPEPAGPDGSRRSCGSG